MTITTPQADAPASPSPQGRGTNGASALMEAPAKKAPAKRKRREVAYTKEVTAREDGKASVNSIDQRGELRHDHREVCRLIVGGLTDREALARKADVEVHVVDLVLGSALCEGYMAELRGEAVEVTPEVLQTKLKPLALSALEFYERILKSPDDYKTRDVVSIARDVLDRTVGANRVTGRVVSGTVEHRHEVDELVQKVNELGDEMRRNGKLMGAITTTAEPVEEDEG